MRRIIAILLVYCLAAVSCHRNYPFATDVAAPTVTLPTSESKAEFKTSEPVVVQPGQLSPPIATLSALLPLPSPTPYASALPLPTPSGRLTETYVIQWGDTLSGISAAYDVPVEELIALNGLGSEAAIIQAGQTLMIPLAVSRGAPQVMVLPDSEVVFSPAYVGFDLERYVEKRGGHLARFSEVVDGDQMTGLEIIDQLARQYSVGPRVLLALLEHYGGWVTAQRPLSRQHLGAGNPYYQDTLFLQLSWAANRINQGYYGYKRDGSIIVRFLDNSRAIVPGGLNAGTAGIMNILALNGDWESWLDEAKTFSETYQRLFGNPFDLAYEPVVPADLTQPELRLPWSPGETFYFTGGPHAAFGMHSAWAAVDFTPPDVGSSCLYSNVEVTAAADGRLILGDTGELYLDLDGDGDLETGWVLLYLHIVAHDDVDDYVSVVAGTPLGYASCEGGISTASHLHFARRYNGEWMAADGPVPFVLSGWTARADVSQYDGTLERRGVTKTACQCEDKLVNALTGE